MANVENSDAICRSSRTCLRIGRQALIDDRAQRPALILVHALQVLGGELDRRQGILDFVRDLPGHLRPGLQLVRARQLRALGHERLGHGVEVVDKPAELVGAVGDAAVRQGGPRRLAAWRVSAARPDRNARGDGGAEHGGEQHEQRRCRRARRG